MPKAAATMSPDPSPLAVLVDANIYIRRAFHSLPTSIQDSAGRPINAAFGFGRFLIKLLSDVHPTHAAALFDYSLESSFRRSIYPAYKANRQPPPKELEQQFPLCEELGRSLGFAVYQAFEFEADDLIATLSKQISGLGISVLIASTDKDLAQLVSGSIRLLDQKCKQTLTNEQMFEQFGVHPHQIPDLLGLIGDPVDNIPGVTGIGSKTAQRLLSTYHDIESIYSHLAEVEAAPRDRPVAARLRRGKEQAMLSKRLATLRADIPLQLDLQDLLWNPLTPQRERRLAELELSGVLGVRSTQISLPMK